VSPPPEVAGQRQEDGRDGRHNRSHPRRPCPSVISGAPEPDAHGRIADGGGPESRLEARTRWSAGVTRAEGAGCKTVGSAYAGSNPTPATTCGNGREISAPAKHTCLDSCRWATPRLTATTVTWAGSVLLGATRSRMILGWDTGEPVTNQVTTRPDNAGRNWMPPDTSTPLTC
jgi:hypothetical protein